MYTFDDSAVTFDSSIVLFDGTTGFEEVVLLNSLLHIAISFGSTLCKTAVFQSTVT